MNAEILIVEDEAVVAKDLQLTLRRLGYDVPVVVRTAAEALRRVAEHRPDLILMDIRLDGDMDGIDVANILRSRYRLSVIYVTAYTDEQTLERAKVTEPFGYVVKPFDERNLYTTIEMALYRAHVEERLRESEETLRRERDVLEQRVQERTALAEEQARKMRQLAIETTRAVQRERRRLAMVLHDQLQQLLVAAKMKIDLARQRVAPDLRQGLDEACNVLDESMGVSRSLTTELRPPVLQASGLAKAMEWLFRSMQDKHRLQVRGKLNLNDRSISLEMQELIFDAVRELLFNVVKHAKTSEAAVQLDCDDQGQLTVHIVDHGVGFRCHPDPETGFGLLELRHRIESMGGSLHVDSEPGRGTRVTINLLVEEPTEPEPQTYMPQDEPEVVNGSRNERHGSIRVLLVDDHKILREGIAGLLRDHGDFQVVGEAADGKDAVRQAYELDPNVVIMDINLPGLSGVEATRMIKAGLPHVHIVGLSMHADEEVISEMIDAGASAYLSKGGPADDLYKAIHRCVANTGHEPHSALTPDVRQDRSEV